MILRCSFRGNSAGGGGGGARVNWSTHPDFISCTFSGNHARVGGGIASYHGGMAARFCSFLDNYASEGGGGLSFESGETGEVTRCTFSGNEVGPSGTGAGIRSASDAAPEVRYSIVAFGRGGAGVSCSDANLLMEYCCVFGNASGDSLCGDHADNIFVDPMFCDPEAGEFSLHEDSPCVPGNNPWSASMGAHGVGCYGS